MHKIAVVFILLSCSLFAKYNLNITNTNITVEDKYLYNYNRLRVDTEYFKDEYFIKTIADAVNFYGKNYVVTEKFNYIKLQDADTMYKTKTNFYNYEDGTTYAKLYRLYGGYDDGYNRVALGLQNITMGVGRIWTPTNKFNPKNIYAIESDETYGVSAFSYTKYLDDTSSMMGVVAQKGDGSFKYAFRYNTFLDLADVAFSTIKDNDISMFGLEMEADILDTGVEARVEVAYESKKDTYEFIAGFDYGFVNGTTLIVESLYQSEYEESYTAVSLSQSFNIFLDASVVYIDSFDNENSKYLAPSLTYTMNDFNSFTLGAQVYDDNTFYFKWCLSF
jgi:hypothetical protein